MADATAAPDAATILADVQKGLQGLLTILAALTGTKAVGGAAAGSTGSSTTVGASLSVDLIPVATGAEAAITAGEKIAETVTVAENTPAMVQSVEAQRKQDQLDRFNAALQTHDSDAIERALAAL